MWHLLADACLGTSEFRGLILQKYVLLLYPVPGSGETTDSNRALLLHDVPRNVVEIIHSG